MVLFKMFKKTIQTIKKKTVILNIYIYIIF